MNTESGNSFSWCISHLRLDSHNEGADENRVRECTVSCAHLRLFFGKLGVEIFALLFRLRPTDGVSETIIEPVTPQTRRIFARQWRQMSLVTLDHARVSSVAKFPGVPSLNMLKGVASCAHANVYGNFYYCQVLCGPRAAAAAGCRPDCYRKQVTC
jgi:hypothetical protein